MFSSVEDFYKKRQGSKGAIKLHLGCGSKYLDGWCNIDAHPPRDTDTHRGALSKTPDIWCDIKKLPAANESVDVIYTAHVIEHFHRHSAIELFTEFWRVLRPNGVIITEMPDLARIIFLLKFLPAQPNYPAAMRANRDMIKAQLYGAAWEANDDGYPYHKYVWERAEFCDMLSQIGFRILLQTGATQSHVPFRDMAVIGLKPLLARPNNSSVIDHAELVAGYGTRWERAKKQIKSIYTLIRLASNNNNSSLP